MANTANTMRRSLTDKEMAVLYELAEEPSSVRLRLYTDASSPARRHGERAGTVRLRTSNR